MVISKNGDVSPMVLGKFQLSESTVYSGAYIFPLVLYGYDIFQASSQKSSVLTKSEWFTFHALYVDVFQQNRNPENDCSMAELSSTR